jgi:hypothetical protein
MLYCRFKSGNLEARIFPRVAKPLASHKHLADSDGGHVLWGRRALLAPPSLVLAASRNAPCRQAADTGPRAA